MWSSYDGIDDAANNHQVLYYTHFPGIYSETSTAMAEGDGTDVVLVFGCKTYFDRSGTHTGMLADDLYGQCLEGWIHTFRLETFDERTEETDANVLVRHHASNAAAENFINAEQTIYDNNGGGDDWAPADMTI
jgi:hypothetical protein